jgi:hypothetical protein
MQDGIWRRPMKNIIWLALLITGCAVSPVIVDTGVNVGHALMTMDELVSSGTSQALSPLLAGVGAYTASVIQCSEKTFGEIKTKGVLTAKMKFSDQGRKRDIILNTDTKEIEKIFPCLKEAFKSTKSFDGNTVDADIRVKYDLAQIKVTSKSAKNPAP